MYIPSYPTKSYEMGNIPLAFIWPLVIVNPLIHDTSMYQYSIMINVLIIVTLPNMYQLSSVF